jgi:pimeloyl-ACP methyl ester carboxylesterase
MLGRKLVTLFFVSLVTVFMTAACDDDDTFATDVTDTDTSSDSEDGETASAVCGDGICQETEYVYSCDADCEAQGPVLPRGLTDGELTHFPDDILTVADETTDTGRRVDYQGMLDDAAEELYFGLSKALMQVEGIDGFGTTAGGFIRLPGPLDEATIRSGPETTEPGTPVMMGYVDADGTLTLVPIETEAFTENPHLAMRPMLPLEHGSLGFFAMTTDVRKRLDTTFIMDEELYDVLHGETPEGYEEVAPQLNEVADKLMEAGYIEKRTDLAALSTFTVQEPMAKSKRISDHIREEPPEVVEKEECEEKEEWDQCTVSFTAPRYLDDQLHIDDNPDGTPRSTYTIKAEIFLPKEAGEYGTPYPTLIFGHGLSGKRQDGDQIAEFFAPEGIATVVIDAPVHGEHPTATSVEQIDIVFTLFGINTSPDVWIDSRVLRDGWRQSNYDKLALAEVLSAGLDADDDETVELDPDRLIYFGASLGAIQGLEFASLTTDMIANMMAVGGARVTDIVRTGELFGPAVGFILDTLGSASETSIFYILTQTVVDGGDPGSFAKYVLSERVYEDEPQPMAVQMSVPDEVVSNPSNAFYVRSLNVPILGRVAYPIALINSVDGPLNDNHPSGVTAGVLQTDYIWDDGNEEFEAANHSDGPASEEGIEYWTSFVESLLDGDAELVDPYPVLGRERPPVDDDAATGVAVERKAAPIPLDELTIPERPFATDDN